MTLWLNAKAEPRFQEAVRMKPDSGPARNNLATNLARLGRTSEAEAQLQRVIELEPDSYDANHNLGEFYIGKGDLAGATVRASRHFYGLTRPCPRLRYFRAAGGAGWAERVRRCGGGRVARA